MASKNLILSPITVIPKAELTAMVLLPILSAVTTTVNALLSVAVWFLKMIMFSVLANTPDKSA